VVLLEGSTAEQSARVEKELGQHAAFTISDPPSATANSHLMAVLQRLGVASQQQCDISDVINPFDDSCWTGPSAVVKYDLRTVRTPLFLPLSFSHAY
jgi:homogentisate 1,2-dioxygenase